jgi:hypothetical protein
MPSALNQKSFPHKLHPIAIDPIVIGFASQNFAGGENILSVSPRLLKRF